MESSIKIHDDSFKPLPFKGSGESSLIQDDQLTARDFKESKEKGFKRLFSRYYENLCSHAIRFVYSRAIAEDIVSETFLVFWKNDLHLSVSSFKAYFYQSVRHRCYNYLQRELRNEDTLGDISNMNLKVEIPDDILFYAELSHTLNQVIEQLPPQCQRAYILRQVEVKKNKEISLEMGISLKAVEALISRSLLKIREGLKDFL